MAAVQADVWRGAARKLLAVCGAVTMCLALMACGSDLEQREQRELSGARAPERSRSLANTNTNTNTASNTVTTAAVLCDYHGRVRNESASVRATATYQWSCSDLQRLLQANGLPDHDVGRFPNPSNPNTLAAQNVAESFALHPALGAHISARSGPGVPMGFALNGIKLDPGTAGTCNDAGTVCSMGPPSRGPWNIEALGQGYFRFGTDSSNGHVQPGGVYHYHGVPEGLLAQLNPGKSMTLIGWALDGFPIYARYGFSRAEDARSAVALMHGSYGIKETPDPGRPPVSRFPMGTFTQDYAYRAGSGDLDECNGRFGVTPEFPAGIYHYYATDDYPYVQRCVKGRL